ncbi:MAG TPA: hypothetical protein VKV26_07095 [Dehalococcoidia bacterium]|nr:hypothetical protein [Dehalococcoidia bacterium]
MTTARPVRPTDLVALVSFDGRVYANEAHTWDRLGRRAGARLLENAFEQWFSFATGRHTWISVEGLTIRGLISARARGSRLAWEVDCLIIACDERQPTLDALVDQLIAAAAGAGTLRVFLRLEAGSAALEAARALGFMPYVHETLLQLSEPASEQPLDQGLSLRKRARADGFALFRLYNAVTPESVRRYEAATYAEWIAGQERRSQGRGHHDLVAETDGRIVAWLRAVPDGEVGRIDLLLHPDGAAHGPALLAHAVGLLGRHRPLYSLVPRYAENLLAMHREQGFAPVAEFDGLVKRLVTPIKEAKPVRVPAHQPLATG